MKASKIKAEEFMDANPFTVDADSSIASVRNSMEERNLRAVAVERDGQLEGAVSYRDLIRHVQFNPDTTKLEKIVHNPPNFEPEDTVLELCDLRINSGKKLLTCTDPDENLEAVFSDEEFRKALQKVDEVQKISSRDVASFEVVKAFESDSVEKVRHQMLDNNISRIPVLDEDGKLVGVLRSTDVLKLLVPREGQSSGGTSGNSLKDTQIAGGNEKERLSSINVSEVMNRTPTTSQKHISGEKALELMDDRDSHEVLIVDDKYPEAVVTGKDFIKHVAELKASDTVLVNLVGLDVDEEKAAVHEKIETQLRGSLGRKLEDPDELRIRFKKSEKDGNRHRYELTVKLFDSLGQFTVDEEGWDLLEAVDEALSRLNEAVRKEKEKKTDYRS